LQGASAYARGAAGSKEAEAEAEKKNHSSEVETSSRHVQDVYDYWREKRGKTDARYAKRIAPNRRKKIAARLREFTSEELKRCIDGVALDPWEDRPRHDDLTIIFRSQEQVEKFLALSDDVSVMSREDRLRRHFDSLKERGVT
jgi:hypothetical protein